MKIALVRLPDDSTSHGIVDDNVIELLGGSPYDGVRRSGRRMSLESVQLLAPVVPSKIFGVGKNYADHIEEMGYPWPHEPSIFLKPPSSVIGPEDNIVLPPTHISDKVQHEGELAVVIGKRVRGISEEEVDDAIFGATCSNDVSARDLQNSDFHVTRAKGYDTFCPLGPWIETEVDLFDSVTVECEVNGLVRQAGSTSALVFRIHYLISYLSSFATLNPGDVVLTGSPGGSDDLAPGDEVIVRVAGVGQLRNGVVR